MRGNSRVDADSRSRCVKDGNSKLRLESGQPFSGGVRGSEENSVNSAVVRPRMARYWEALTWPERGDGQIRQELERSGLTRRQWKIRLMREKVLQMQETSDVEIGGVLQKLIDSSPKLLKSNLEEGLLLLLSGVMEVAGSQALGALSSVLQALDAMPGDECADEEEESYYPDEDGEEDVSPDLAGSGIGECGRVQLTESLWRRAVPDDVMEKYREWLKDMGGWGQQRSGSDILHCRLVSLSSVLKDRVSAADSSSNKPPICLCPAPMSSLPELLEWHDSIPRGAGCTEASPFTIHGYHTQG